MGDSLVCPIGGKVYPYMLDTSRNIIQVGKVNFNAAESRKVTNVLVHD